MKKFFYKFYHSFPIQLLLLHFRRYQVLLIFWLLLFSTINGNFASLFGAASLFLAPEYLGRVSFYSALILGISVGAFIMSWNITTFILHSRRFKFLATTTQPFFKYCLNNAIIPVAFLIFLLVKGIQYQKYYELNSTINILFLIEGFMCGYLLFIFISFFYFFNADKTILRSLQQKMGSPRKLLKQIRTLEPHRDVDALKVTNYFNSPLKIKRARNVDHYQREFLDDIFRQHHFATVITIGIAIIFLVIMGYFTFSPAFRIPAGASVFIFFAVLIGVSGAFVYFFRSWSIPVIVLLLLLVNWLITKDIIDNRSKAYGLDYTNHSARPEYSVENLQHIFTDSLARKDADSTLLILNRWRAKFRDTAIKPKLVLLNVSGGGSRSACWTMNVLQQADSLLHGELMNHTVLITGASGGMMGAAYYRELYLEKLRGKSINLHNPEYTENISKDLLNAIFSSFAVNDLFTPFQSFHIGTNKYAKDRGYAFELQLNANTGGVLDKKLGYYAQPEKQALIPMMIFGATVTADGRKMLVSPQAISYLTFPRYLPAKTTKDIDAIDFCHFFEKQHPKELLLSSAIRMNATFPYVLPNVYLPTKPIIDVMDAGIRDTYGKETSLRFLYVFRKWIATHTSGVILIQVRDTRKNYVRVIEQQKDLNDIIFEPLFTMQHNWSSFQDYYQDDLFSYAQYFLQVPLRRITFQYTPEKDRQQAALNFHLTSREIVDIHSAVYNKQNLQNIKMLKKMLAQ